MSSDAAPDDGDRGETDAGEAVEDLPAPPKLDGYPLVGSALTLARSPRAFFDLLDDRGDVVRYDVVSEPFVALLHPDHVQQVLLDDFDRFGKWSGEEFTENPAPDGVVFTEGDQWRRQRTAMQDAFTMSQVQSYAGDMRRGAQEMVDGWDDGDVVALNDAFSRLTLRVLVRSLFDLELADQGDYVREFTTVWNERADGSNPSNFLPAWVPTPLDRRYRRVVSEMRSFVEGVIEQRRGDEADHDDLLSLLLAAEDDEGRGLSDDEVRDQVMTFLVAGQETTSLVLTYTFLELAKHPEVRERLDAEHESVLGGDAPTMADLGELTYTEQVLKEAMRLYPPAYALWREAKEDVEIGGYRVAEGSKVTLSQFALHRDEWFYDDPGQFRPERWADGFEDELHDYAYFPFGGGPRHCMGMRFAMLELKHVVPIVAQAVDFELLSDPDPELSFGVTLQPAADVRARVSTR